MNLGNSENLVILSKVLLAFQPPCLHLFPQLLLLIIQLARQGVDGNLILRTELSPQNKTEIVLPG